MNDLKWYCFDQNNSGGYFKVDEKVCHRLFIEAESFDNAVAKAEELGCYWDGVNKGMDCSCCGDRWNKWDDDPVDIEEYRTKGYMVCVYDGIYENTRNEWEKKYRRYGVVEEPKFETKYSMRKYIGKISFDNIEEYAQYLANEYGWTVPDARVYYNDGSVREIFTEKI